MPSPEGYGGQPPQSGESRKEREQLPYALVARFQDEQPAMQTYAQAQELIFGDERADLSVYRFLLDQVSHVAAVGEPPPEEIDQELQEIFSLGEPTALPEEVLKALQQRRNQMKQHGSWVEGHYRPGWKLGY